VTPRRVSGAIALVFAVCAFRVFRLIDSHGVDLVVMDQWDFFVPLFDQGYGWLDKMRFQFEGSPHRMGVGWPLIEWTARLSGFSTRADGFVIAGVLCAAAALALEVKRRITGRLELADACLPLVFLTLRQWGTFVATPDVSLGAMPVLLLVAGAFALTLGSPRARVAWLLAVDLACIYTGFAMFAGIVIPVLLLREAWLGHWPPARTAGVLGVSLAFGLSYFVGFDAAPATGPVAGDGGLGTYPSYADYASYATNLFASALGVRSAWAAIAVGMLWPLLLGVPLVYACRELWRRSPEPGPAAVGLLCGFGLLFVLANTLGRVGEGVSFAYTPRYVTLMLPALFGLYLAIATGLGGRMRQAALSVFIVVWCAGELAGGAGHQPAAAELAQAKRDWKQCYFVTRDVARCNAAGRYSIYPWREKYPAIERRLAWLEQHGLNLFASPPASPPPVENVLLVSVDTLRADHVSWQGYERDTTPALDALARRGLVFRDAMSTSSWTLPAHGSLLTGRYPSQHGAQDDGSALSPAVPTLAELFSGAGFDTFGVVSHVYVASPFGFERGFATFDDSLIEGGTTNPRGDAVIDRAIAWLDTRDPARRFFAFVHLYDPHWDYAAPEPLGRRWVSPGYRGPIDGRYETMIPFLAGEGMEPADRNALVGYYDGEIAWVDRQIARLIDALEQRGVLAETLVVLTSDHGEEFLDHGRLGHGRTMYQEQLHVPLVFRHDSLPRERRPEPVSLVDVAPTLLALAGVEPPVGLPGRSLLAPVSSERVLFAESIRFGLAWRAARRGPHKVAELAEAGGRAFFDLASDPAERRPGRSDPSGGVLSEALDAYAASADSGWHWRIVAPRGERVRLRARFESDGRFVGARHFASGRIEGRDVVFHRFEVSGDGHALEVDVEATSHQGSIRFELEPSDAVLRVEVEEIDGGAVHWASGEPVRGRRFELERGDPRLLGSFATADRLEPGLHVRAIPASGGVSGAARARPLGDEARRHLEALGYGAD